MIIGNSLNPDAFNIRVQNRLEERQEYLIKKNWVSIQVSTELADVFSSSRMVSSKIIISHLIYIAKKGRSNLLLNRTKRFEKLEKEQAIKDKIDTDREMIENLKKEIIEMRDEIAGQENEWYDSRVNKEILNKLFEKKVIDKDRNSLL